MSTVTHAPSSQAALPQTAVSSTAGAPPNGTAIGKPRWAALDSRNERLATAADSVPFDRTDSDRELKAS